MIVLIVLRLLESTNDVLTCRQRAYAILTSARTLAFNLTKKLLERLSNVTDDSSRAEIQRNVYEMAAICCYTFDVSEEHFDNIFLHANDLRQFLFCATVVQDNLPPIFSDEPLHARLLLSHHWRLLHRLEVYLRQRIISDPAGLDSVMQSLWSDYNQAGNSWQALSNPNERYLNRSFTSAGGQTMVVHINLLDGQLLVNGRLLGRLPKTITEHKTFTRMFGRVSDVLI
jgi:hypothetical protein